MNINSIFSQNITNAEKYLKLKLNFPCTAATPQTKRYQQFGKRKNYWLPEHFKKFTRILHIIIEQ